MKILLHICCGPCTTFPLLASFCMNVMHKEGDFYNPNIHFLFTRLSSGAYQNARLTETPP